MKTESMHLFEIIQKARPELEAISEERASTKTIDGKWSIKEIIGHLIDSAANNHQRFVRLQSAAENVSIRYDQEFWVNVQAYQSEKWADLVDLWYYYNKHLSHVMENLNQAMLDNKCDMGYPEQQTLGFVVKDYNRHLEHHLKQILSGVEPERREK
jgi:chromosome condensin MukBEF ATPase and DNA-binding subunit MukB